MSSIDRKPRNIRENMVSWYVLQTILTAFLIAGRSAAGEAPSAGDAALFDRLDANRNDVIAADEVTADNRRLFDRLLRRADTNHDKALSRDEFLASLVLSRPEKPIEAKQPSTVPEANAVRYLLLAMDTNRNSRIEKDEVPRDLSAAFEFMTERLDRNGNGGLERQELSRGGPALSAVAGRHVKRLGINVDAELAKLEKSEGSAVNRFEQQPMPLENLRDPQQARQLFAQFDENADGKLDAKEVPDPLRERIERLTRIADRDNDGKLDEREFVTATERISKIFRRRQAEEMAERDRTPERESMPRKAKADNK